MNPEGNRKPLHLVLLHSNDIHGAFAPKTENGLKKGGISLLSGFVLKTRREEKNVLYAMAGDLFMGSILDSEYRGLSTIRLANALAPDVFAVGNHEIDYGLSHLLFLEKCADFPIICANLAVRELNRTLFRPWIDLECGGLRVRFIGLLTESISGKIRQEELIDQEVSVRSVFQELSRVMRAVKKEKKADITVLLTHIGIEEDKALAEKLESGWDIGLIVGGHSHTFLEHPVIVNGIPIVQAGFGSGQIGRCDIDVDPGTRGITRFSWQLIPVDENNSEPDELLEFYQERYERRLDEKYGGKLAALPREYVHNGFHRETEVIDLFTDLYREAFETDIFLLSSNAIRCRTFGPEVTRRDLLMALPYDNEVFRISMNGARLEKMLSYMLRKESWEGVNIFILYSGTLKIVFEKETKEIRSLELFGAPPDADRIYTVGITSYLRKNLHSLLGIAEGELPVSRLASKDRDRLEEYLLNRGSFSLENTGRAAFAENGT